MKYLICFFMTSLFPIGLSNEFLGTFQEWWMKMNSQKHLTCLSSDPPINTFKSYLITYDCPAERNRRETFAIERLRINKDDGKLRGTGKISLGHSKSDDLCAEFGQLLELKITSIEGKFLNGYPDGQVKITLANGDFVMADAVNGTFGGLIRIWDKESRKLTRVCYVSSKRCWKQENSKFLYARVQEDDKSITLLLDLITMEVMSGYLWEPLLIIEDLGPPLALNYSHTHCMLNVNYELYLVEFSSPVTQNKYFAVSRKNEYLTEDHEWETSDFKKNIQSWFNQLSPQQLWEENPDSRRVFDNAPQILRNLKPIDDNHFSAYVLHESIESIFFLRSSAAFPYNGRVRCLLEKNKVTILKEYLINGEIKEIDAYFSNGVVDRFLIISFSDGRCLYAKVKSGVFHGLFLVSGVRLLLPLSVKMLYDKNLLSDNQLLGMTGRFYNGGLEKYPQWVVSIGGGVYYRENRKGIMKTLAYIYPDMKTALIGEFDGLIMKSALPGVLTHLKKQGGVYKAVFKIHKGSINKEPVFFKLPTNTSFGGGPRVMDPLEEINVKLARSKIPNSGDGVFAIRSFEPDDIVCFYSGLKLRDAEEKDIFGDNCLNNMSLTREERHSCHKFSITTSTGEFIDIPKYLDIPGAWHPTLGHKVNNQFPKWGLNAEYRDYEHPRYGLIIAILAVKNIAPGEEVYVDYSYTYYSEEHSWYFRLKDKYNKWLNNRLENSKQKDEL